MCIPILYYLQSVSASRSATFLGTSELEFQLLQIHMAKIVICFAWSDGNFCFIAKGYALLVYVFFSWTFFNIVVVVFVVVVVVIIKDISLSILS